MSSNEHVRLMRQAFENIGSAKSFMDSWGTSTRTNETFTREQVIEILNGYRYWVQREVSLAPTPATAGSGPDFEQMIAEYVQNLREGCHATYNGGHHEEPAHDAFHHGMDTVCNVLERGGSFRNLLEKVATRSTAERPTEQATRKPETPEEREWCMRQHLCPDNRVTYAGDMYWRPGDTGMTGNVGAWYDTACYWRREYDKLAAASRPTDKKRD